MNGTPPTPELNEQPSETMAAPSRSDEAKREYQKREQHFDKAVKLLERRQFWFGNARLGIFILIVAFSWMSGRGPAIYLYLLLASVTAFVAMVVSHRRIVREAHAGKRARSFYARGIARIEDRWAGAGDTGMEFRQENHLYADDLDILGDGGLFQLLCTARTRMGKSCLAGWLLGPATRSVVLERQAAVAELRSQLDFREELATTGENEKISADPEALSCWADASDGKRRAGWWPWLAASMALLSMGTLVYGFRTSFWAPFLLSILINGSVTFTSRHYLEMVFSGLSKTSGQLEELSQLLHSIEQAKFSSPCLLGFHSRLKTHGHLPSDCISKLGRLTQLEDSRRNMFVQLFDVPLLYSLQLAFALERWRQEYGPAIKSWLDVVGEFEALVSLSAYAYEHPADPFPEMVEASSTPFFDGHGLGHPLLAESKCVRNDLTIGAKAQVFMVSGSNMSGKSTYLRTVGTNAVLAMMGSVVRAARLRISPLTIGASMRTSDSLQKGTSHFYAEISRIRDVVQSSSAGPLLFLLDEVLQGTNSDDRRQGTEAILRKLVQNGAIGLVTTHDLALTSLDSLFGGNVQNVHFQEELVDGKLSFDYQRRAGVVTTRNGVELMKSIGLLPGNP